MRWLLQERWHQGRLQQVALVAGIGLSMAALLVAAVVLRQAQRDESARQLDAGVPAAAQASGAAVAAPGRDFTAALGPAQPSEQWVAVIQSAAQRAGVTLVSVQVQEHAAALDRLGRTELPLVLQGPYAGVKRCVAEVLERIPTSRFQFRYEPGAV